MTPKSRGVRVPPPEGTLDIALSLAAVGWPVFPVSIYEDEAGKRHKVPAVKWKAEATTDPDTIREWWTGEHRRRWIGVYAGAAGIVVLDLDPAKPATAFADEQPAGVQSLEAAGLEVPKTFTYPSHRKGGRHHVYRAPDGVDLTIAKNLLPGVDVRSGAGLMVYYGPKLDGPPRLAPAPDWLLVRKGETRHEGGGIDRAPDADVDAYLERLAPGKPPKKVAKLIRGVDFPSGAAHEPMLATVAALVDAGVRGHAGIGELIDETRERYVGDHPDRGRDWDNALAGSVRRFGLPPATLELSKVERKAIAERNRPEAIEAARLEKRAERVNRMIVDADDLTQDGLAEQFAKAVEGLWTNTTSHGLLHYEGGVWRVRDRAVLIDHARLFLRVIRAEQTKRAIARGDARGEKAAALLGGRSFIGGVADLAAGALLADEPVLDDHPDLLNTPSGVVDLRTGELRPHDPKLYMTKITGAPYDPNADMTLWHKALEAVPPKVADWLQVRMGQAATGYTPDDDALLIFEGSGSNGKTTVVASPRMALGEYAVKLSEKVLMAEPGDHPTSLMRLMGARLALFEELSEGHSLNIKRLKDTVGTPEITARYMRQDEVTFPATHAMMGTTNYLPIVAETDHGTWRRLALVRFRRRYVKSRKKVKGPQDVVGDPRIRRHFESVPDPGVLRWMVEGAVRWYQNGRQMPDEMPKVVERDTQAWRMDADAVLAYVTERIVRDPSRAIPCADLADDFNAWLERGGHRRWSQQTVNSRFAGHATMEGIERKVVKWGLNLTPSRPPFAIKPVSKTTKSWRGIRFADEGPSIGSEAQRDAATLAELERMAGGD